ncbi:hypothetical protein H9Q69_012003 [Fusarium xylarioides]|nr:hypothetical protein H9Q69_012003 [Fusarium xylarioides]
MLVFASTSHKSQVTTYLLRTYVHSHSKFTQAHFTATQRNSGGTNTRPDLKPTSPLTRHAHLHTSLTAHCLHSTSKHQNCLHFSRWTGLGPAAVHHPHPSPSPIPPSPHLAIQSVWVGSGLFLSRVPLLALSVSLLQLAATVDYAAYFRPACSPSLDLESQFSPVTFGSAVPGLPPPSAIRFLTLVRPSFFHSDWLDLRDTRFTIYNRH